MPSTTISMAPSSTLSRDMVGAITLVRLVIYSYSVDCGDTRSALRQRPDIGWTREPHPSCVYDNGHPRHV